MKKGLLITISTIAMISLIACAGGAGDQGSQGIQGIQGISGIQGPEGPQGPAGPAGPQGAAGKDGSPGMAGKQGIPGKDGAGATGVVVADVSGTSAVISGAGFSGGEEITLTAAGAIEIGSATANSGGAFSVNISVIGLPSGAHSLEANGAMGVIVIGGASALQQAP